MATMASSRERGAEPKSRLPSPVAFFTLPTRQDLLCRRIEERDARTSQFGLPRVGTRSRPRRCVSSDRGNFADRHEIAGDREKAPALGGGMVMARMCRSATSRTSTMPK